MTLGGATIAADVVYLHSSQEVFIGAAVSGLNIDLQSAATRLVGLDLPREFSGVVMVPNFAITGRVTSSETELIVSETGGSLHAYIVYQRMNQLRRAVAVELTSGLASVLEDVIGLDISGISYFDSVTPTIGLTLANDSITGLPDDVFAASPLLSTLGGSIEANLTAIIAFPFASQDPVELRYSGGVPTFLPLNPGSIDVQSLISGIPSFDLSSIALPPGVGGLLQLSVDRFSFDVQAKLIEIVVSYPGSLVFFDGFLTVTNPTVFIAWTSQVGTNVAVDGDLSISGSGFTVSITRDLLLDTYTLSASANLLPITGLVDQFQSEVLPSELNSLATSLPFFSFSINDPTLSFPLSSSPLQIQLGGTPVISGYNTLHMASVIIRESGKTLLVQGFDLGSVNLASFLRSITGYNFNNIAILNQDLEAAILISPVTLPNVQLTGEKLSGFSITRGLSVQATMQFPSDCSSDEFCAVAAYLLGASAQLNIQGTIASTTSFSLTAGVSNINMGSGVVMSEAGVEIHGGTENSVGIYGAVDLSDPDITLTARIYLSTSGVVLEMIMSGCWENAFGASWLDICSIQSSVAMIPGVPLTGLSLGGQVRIGDDSCGTPLVATGFIGIDVLTPSQNYYYVNLEGSATVGTILEALCIDTDVPAPLSESGFPNGFLSSFSLFGVELPHVPLSIPQGFRFEGTLNILGLEASANVTIALPDGMDFEVALPPIIIGGELLQMTASESDTSQGPFLTADVALLPSPSVNIKASGYLSVLGISLETTMTITNDQYVFEIEGNFLTLFEASLHISASYGDIHTASFRVQGSFTNNLYDRLEDLIKDVLGDAADIATSAFDAAERDLNSAKDTLDSARDSLDDARDEVDKAQRAFDDAADEVDGLSDSVDNICSTKSCSRGEFITLYTITAQ